MGGGGVGIWNDNRGWGGWGRTGDSCARTLLNVINTFICTFLPQAINRWGAINNLLLILLAVTASITYSCI